MAIDHRSLVPVLVRAIQQLKSLCDSDQDTLAKLKADNDDLRPPMTTKRRRSKS